jgi:DNA-binding transcriptional MerR regulator
VTPLPPKLYFRIGEVANLVGVEPHVLRYWEREFRSIRPTKSAKGQRVYSRRDVENLMRVRDLLYADGFTIAGAKKKLQRNGTEPDADGEAQAEKEPAGTATRRAEEAPPTPPTPREPETRATEPVKPAKHANGDGGDGYVRAALTELRGEIEALLAELG